LGKLSMRRKLSEVILIGDERVLNIFQKDCLSTDAKKKVIATLPSIPGSTEGELAHQIQKLLQQHEVSEEGYYLDMISRENGVVKGLNEVVSAQNRHMVRSLLVNKELKQPGYFCNRDKYISVETETCPLCGTSMQEIDNVVEKLIELAS